MDSREASRLLRLGLDASAVVGSCTGAGSFFLGGRWGADGACGLTDLLLRSAMAVAATGAYVNGWLVFVAPVVAVCDRGWDGTKSFRCMGHVRIVLGRGTDIGIFSCNSCALMGLVVGAILGGLLVGGCVGR